MINKDADDSTGDRPWKRIAKLGLWLYLMSPVGWWKLYHDPVLTTATKWRILIYLYVLPTLIYMTVGFWSVNSAIQKYIP
jgi:hypothetical protein